jgi:hypothetical protein
MKLIDILKEIAIKKPHIVKLNLPSNLDDTYSIDHLDNNFGELIDNLKNINFQIPSEKFIDHDGIYEDVFDSFYAENITQSTLREFLRMYFTWLYSNLVFTEFNGNESWSEEEQKIFVDNAMKGIWTKFKHSTDF